MVAEQQKKNYQVGYDNFLSEFPTFVILIK